MKQLWVFKPCTFCSCYAIANDMVVYCRSTRTSVVVHALRRKIRYLTFFLDRATRFEKSGFTEKEIKVACQVPISGCKATTTKHGCFFFLYHHPSRASEAGSKYPLLVRSVAMAMERRTTWDLRQETKVGQTFRDFKKRESEDRGLVWFPRRKEMFSFVGTNQVTLLFLWVSVFQRGLWQ